VARDLDYFIHLMIRWMVVAVPASVCNTLIKFCESSLATSFRARLTEYSLKKYMENEVYYRVLNSDDRVTNADQRLTEDVANFCNNLAHVHSQLSKPCLDVLMSTINLISIGNKGNLRRGAGTAASIIAAVTVWASATLVRVVCVDLFARDHACTVARRTTAVGCVGGSRSSIGRL
jgi:ATP-binding cassette subfamily D (ALD) long-chain fatty acid import protein